MKIAQIAPLDESVPPQLYGGTERVVSVLTEELVRRGHSVTLFASGDSETSASLVSCAERSLRLDPNAGDTVAFTLMELTRVFDAQDEFDVLHNHVDYLAFPFARQSRTPMVTTTHGRLDMAETRMIYDYFSEANLVSISQDQRGALPNANWSSTVYNGIDFEFFKLHREPGKYLSFLGRFSPEKRADRAIEVARALDMPLKLAAKIGENDRDYFEHAIKPQLDSSLIEYVGEVNEQEKNDFLGNAFAYLFPIDWPEPFGLTMVEAMACGTPVIAMEAGAVSEVVVDGVSGFVCQSFRDFMDCVSAAGDINRQGCREYAQSRFSPEAMADGYERVYEGLINEKPVTK